MTSQEDDCMSFNCGPSPTTEDPPGSTLDQPNDAQAERIADEIHHRGDRIPDTTLEPGADAPDVSPSDSLLNVVSRLGAASAVLATMEDISTTEAATGTVAKRNDPSFIEPVIDAKRSLLDAESGVSSRDDLGPVESLEDYLKTEVEGPPDKYHHRRLCCALILLFLLIATIIILPSLLTPRYHQRASVSASVAENTAGSGSRFRLGDGSILDAWFGGKDDEPEQTYTLLSDPPSSVPSPGPSDFPSMVPSSMPVMMTSLPTGEPTTLPTEEPTATPVSPTGAPTSLPPLQKALVGQVSADLLNDPSTPESRAYRFMAENDTSGASGIAKLLQRYIMYLLDFTFHPSATELTIGDPAVDECDWAGVTCSNATGRYYEPVDSIVWPGRNMSGSISSQIGKLGYLYKFDIAENSIGGSIPDELYNLRQLQYVYAFSNQLTGPLTENINGLRSLRHLYLGDNQLTGTLPEGLGFVNGYRPLRYLILYKNRFTGSIPASWGLRNAFFVDLSYNQLAGYFPSQWIEDFANLRHLYLDHNNMAGTIPDNVGDLGNSRLNQLTLNGNDFSGTFSGKSFTENDTEGLMLNTLHLQDTSFSKLDKVCSLSVFEDGEMTSFQAECNLCQCEYLCDYCRN